MINMFSTSNRIDRFYRLPKKSIYSDRFFEDICSNYSYILGGEDCQRKFLSFEPYDCKIAKLIEKKHNYDLSHYLESVINSVTFSLIAYGKSYVYITPEYVPSKKSDPNGTKQLSSLDIKEIKGIIKKESEPNHIVFYYKEQSGTISKIKMQRNQIIIFDIRDIGYRKKYFSRILKRLAKCDTFSASPNMVTDNVDSYNFSAQAKKYKLLKMKATKDIGWSFGTDGLSDSYILYKKIQERQLKLRFLNYILKMLNFGLNRFVSDSKGNLIAHIKEINYDQIWMDYSNGRMTGAELSNILFRNY